MNRELRSRGINEKLVRGKDYYYFMDGDAATWRSASVLVYRASDLPLEQWLEEWSNLSGRQLPEKIHA